MLTNIVDGWLLNPRIRYVPYRAVPMQLGQMEALRRAHNLRDRWVVLPGDFTTPIAGYGQFNKEIQVAPCSYLWSIAFREFGAEGTHLLGEVAPPVDFSLQITDENSGAEIASEFVSAAIFWPGNDGFLSQPLLTQPRIIAGKGLVSVRIANSNKNSKFCQLILYFLEPCEIELAEVQCA